MKFPHLSLLVPAVATAALALAPGHATAETAYGLTSTSQLVQFDTSSPSNTTFLVGALTPAAGQQIVGIDFQPASFGNSGGPTLFALGYNTSTNFAQIYTINVSSGALTAVGSGATIGTGAVGSFGFDFNPMSGGIRVVLGTTTNNNYRFSAATGALAGTDTALAYASGDTGNPTGGPASQPQIVGAAYTNNFAGTASTTLYGYDFGRDALVMIGSTGGAPNSPNSGILTTVGLFPAASQAQTSAVGFDISSATGTAFLSSQGNAGTNFYTVNLANGQPTLAGNFGAFTVNDFAVVPEPGSVALSALGLGALAVAVRRRKKA